jgi:cation diffusion facilitator family transporter
MNHCGCELSESAKLERATLWMLLTINGGMFLLESVIGWWSDSAGLLADSLDMLADALVYGIALAAVGRSLYLQVWSALGSGLMQIVLGVGVVVEVLRRFIVGSDPASLMMISVGGIALVANVTCLILLAKHREGGAHMRASWIFSTNDVIANVGVIISGAMVIILGSRYPDLIIGIAISLVVIFGGVRILRDSKQSLASGL